MKSTDVRPTNRGRPPEPPLRSGVPARTAALAASHAHDRRPAGRAGVRLRRVAGGCAARHGLVPRPLVIAACGRWGRFALPPPLAASGVPLRLPSGGGRAVAGCVPPPSRNTHTHCMRTCNASVLSPPASAPHAAALPGSRNHSRHAPLPHGPALVIAGRTVNATGEYTTGIARTARSLPTQALPARQAPHRTPQTMQEGVRCYECHVPYANTSVHNRKQSKHPTRPRSHRPPRSKLPGKRAR